MSAADFTARLRGMGFRGPYRLRSGSGSVIEDADGKPLGMVLNGSDSRRADRDWLAETWVAALNAACAHPAPALRDPLDPHHLAAVSAESRHFAERVAPGSLPDAAE